MPAASPASVGVARAIAASLLGGITTFAAVAWVIATDRPVSADDPATATLFLYAWIALALGAAVAAVVLWRVNVLPRIHRARGDLAPARDEDPAADAETLQSSLVITWALIEAPALLGIVIYLLYGSTLTFAGGLLLAWLGIGLTWPRTTWFPAADR